MLMEAARHGEVMTIHTLAKHLQNTPCGQGMTQLNIKRRLKGKLPIAQARATATKNQEAGTQSQRKDLY